MELLFFYCGRSLFRFYEAVATIEQRKLKQIRVNKLGCADENEIILASYFGHFSRKCSKVGDGRVQGNPKMWIIIYI